MHFNVNLSHSQNNPTFRQFQREDRFGNGHFSNKYVCFFLKRNFNFHLFSGRFQLLGACSRTFRDELFGSSRQYSPNFPVPTAAELRLIDSAVNPFCMPKETLNSSSLTRLCFYNFTWNICCEMNGRGWTIQIQWFKKGYFTSIQKTCSCSQLSMQ